MDEWEIDKCDEVQTKTTEDAKSLTKCSFLIACIVFLLAITIRFIYLYESSANPSFQTPIVDSHFYDEAARAFAEGQGLGSRFFWQPFFYQFFLSVVYFFSGNSIISAKVIQVLLGGLTCALTYRLAEVIFDRRIGFIAGLITVFYGPMFFYDSELLATGWATFWVVVVLLLFLKAKEKDKGWHWFFLGLCGALSIITRPTFLPFFIAGFIWLRFQVQRGSSLMTRFGPLFLGMMLVLVPVGVVTMLAVGKFSIIPFSGGINLYIGNNPDYCRTLTARPKEGREELIELPLQHDVRRNVWKYDRFLRQQVMEYAKSQPLDFVKGLGRKTLEFVCSREIPRNISIYVFSRWSRLLHLLTWKAYGFGFPFGFIFPLAVLGVIFNWRRIPAPVILFMVLYPLSIILVFVTSRYKTPVVPILAILAAAGLVSVVKKVRLRRWREVMIIAVVVVGIVLLSTLPGPFCEEQVDFEPEFFGLVGRMMSDRGINDEALACFSESLRLKPDSPETYYYMGRAFMLQNKLNEAIEHYREALRLKPNHPEAHCGWGLSLEWQGKVNEAIEHYREALWLKPDFPKVHCYIGKALMLQNKLNEAIEHYREALRLEPDLLEARKQLASALARQKKSKDVVQP